jgi:hypothetical protein
MERIFMMSTRPIVAAYYFPNWHVDPRIENIHGHGWTEWRVTQYATPRFDGHDQPKVPLWGYQDESKPEVMAPKISSAVNYGIDAFIFDWYWFTDGPYRERCLNNGFLKAYNNKDIKFAIMWANHDAINAHPGSYWKPAEPIWSGIVTEESFKACTDYCIQHYFNQPNYLRIDGGLYFQIFRPYSMVHDLGGEEKAKVIFDDFRSRVEKAGLGELMLCATVDEWFDGGSLDEKNSFFKKVGFVIGASYGWDKRNEKEDFPALDYNVWFNHVKESIEQKCSMYKMPWSPLVVTGWDSSPRTVQSDMFEPRQFPFGSVVINDTPERFEEALRYVKNLYDQKISTSPMITISCWNEWTEGAYLEPDRTYGYGKLQAIKNVFGRR